LLVKAGVITDAQLKDALQDQVRWGGKLGDILVRMHYVSEEIFVRALSKQLGLARTDLSLPIPPEVLARLPQTLIEENEILPVAIVDDGKTLAIATADPLNFNILDNIRALTGIRIVPWVAGASQIREAIARYFHGVTDQRVDDDVMEIVHTSHEQGAFVSTLEQAASREANPPPMPIVRSQVRMNTYPPGMVPAPPGPAYAPPTNPRLYQTPMPALAAQLYASANLGPPPAVADDPQRPLKALVELLVQKGVISLDEYLARLKR
jgi:hypothetical protein